MKDVEVESQHLSEEPVEVKDLEDLENLEDSNSITKGFLSIFKKTKTA